MASGRDTESRRELSEPRFVPAGRIYRTSVLHVLALGYLVIAANFGAADAVASSVRGQQLANSAVEELYDVSGVPAVGATVAVDQTEWDHLSVRDIVAPLPGFHLPARSADIGPKREPFTVSPLASCTFGQAEAIPCNQVVKSSLTTSDCTIGPNGTYAKLYYFNANAGTQVTIDMTSSGYADIYLYNSAGTSVAEAFSLQGDVASILYTLPTSGNWYIGASDVFGDTSSFTLTLKPILQCVSTSPNLTPYQPSGWSDKIVVSKVTGTWTDDSPLYPTDGLYVDWAIINNGTAATGALFDTELYLDGVLKQTWHSDPPMSADSYGYIPDYSLGTLSAGTHTLKIKTDSSGAIAESNEGDNEYTKTFTVSPPLSAPGTLTGTVRDDGTNAVITGASVSFNGSNTTTGLSGVYTLSGLACASSTLTVTKSGYVTASIAYSFTSCPGTSTKDVTLMGVPTIGSISPNSGSTAGGESVTIFGTHLQSASSVTFGGTAATIGYNPSTGDLRPTPPPHAAGAVNVTVTTPGGSVTANNGYTYVNSVAQPVIVSFAASPSTITAGQSSTLSWTTTNATAVSITGVNGTQPASGSVPVSPSATTTYTLTATGPGGTATAMTTIVVNPAATPIISFAASPSTITAGQSSTLIWTTANATTVSISGVTGTQPANGSVPVSPIATTTYTLTATGPGGTASASTTITVNSLAQPVIVSFTASPSTITAGQSSTLIWTTTNATTVTISGVAGSQPASGSVPVSPNATTTYTLIATGSGGTATATATIVVNTAATSPAALAMQVVGGDYQSGAKGWDWSVSNFVDSGSILRLGYHWNFANRFESDNVLDCSGLVFWSYNKAAGATTYQSTANRVYYEGADGQYRYNSVPISESQLLPGDLLFFHFEGPTGFVSHVAMYVGCCGPNGADVISASSPTVGIVWRTKDYDKSLPGFIGFGRVTTPKVGISFAAHSPVSLIVTDPDGFRIAPDVSFTTSEEVLREIPGVLYYSESEMDAAGSLGASVTAPTAKTGSYVVYVVPKPDTLPTDTYSLDVESAGKTMSLARDVSIRDIPKEGYGVKVSGGSISVFVPAPSSPRRRAVSK